MGKNEKIEKRIDRIMKLPDRLDNLDAGPDFFKGVQKRIYELEQTGPSPSFTFFRNLKLQPVLMSAILMVNIFSALFFILGSNGTSQNKNQYQEYASILLEANTIESNTLGENIVTNFTGEVE